MILGALLLPFLLSWGKSPTNLSRLIVRYGFTGSRTSKKSSGTLTRVTKSAMASRHRRHAGPRAVYRRRVNVRFRRERCRKAPRDAILTPP